MPAYGDRSYGGGAAAWRTLDSRDGPRGDPRGARGARGGGGGSGGHGGSGRGGGSGARNGGGSGGGSNAGGGGGVHQVSAMEAPMQSPMQSRESELALATRSAAAAAAGGGCNAAAAAAAGMSMAIAPRLSSTGELVLSQWATPPPPVLSDGGTVAADAQQQRTVARLTESSMASTFDELDQLAALMRKRSALSSQRRPGTAGPAGAGGNAHLLRERPGGDLPGGNAPAEILTLP